MSEWFKEWFDTEEYLLVYRNRNEADAKKLIDLVLNNITLPPHADILDLACGTGRHAILLAEKGYNVTAVDLSKNLLKIARQAASDAGISINFVRADLRQFSICNKIPTVPSSQDNAEGTDVETGYNLALNLFTSIGYFEEDAENFKIIKNAYNHLNYSGYFVLDYLNRKFLEKTLVPRSINNFSGRTIIQTREITGNRVKKKIVIKQCDLEKQYIESVRLYSKEELFAVFTGLKFKIIKYFGDYDGKEFDSDKSPRIIIIVRK